MGVWWWETVPKYFKNLYFFHLFTKHVRRCHSQKLQPVFWSSLFPVNRGHLPPFCMRLPSFLSSRPFNFNTFDCSWKPVHISLFFNYLDIAANKHVWGRLLCKHCCSVTMVMKHTKFLNVHNTSLVVSLRRMKDAFV